MTNAVQAKLNMCGQGRIVLEKLIFTRQLKVWMALSFQFKVVRGRFSAIVVGYWDYL